MKSSSFIRFWTDLFFRPKKFFETNWKDKSLYLRYFPLAFLIYGTAFGIDRLDYAFFKADVIGGDSAIFNSIINSWGGYWLVAIVGGMAGGYLIYLIGSWFFNLRLKLSKGTSDMEKSRFIFLYSSVIPSSIIIFITLVSTLFEDKPYEMNYEFIVWDIISIFLMIFILFYSVYVSYTGVRTITDVSKWPSVFWFLILPVIYYFLQLLSIVKILFVF